MPKKITKEEFIERAKKFMGINMIIQNLNILISTLLQP